MKPKIINIGIPEFTNIDDSIVLNGNTISRDQAQDLIDVLKDWLTPDTEDESDYHVEQESYQYTYDNLKLYYTETDIIEAFKSAFKAGAEWAKGVYKR